MVSTTVPPLTATAALAPPWSMSRSTVSVLLLPASVSVRDASTVSVPLPSSVPPPLPAVMLALPVTAMSLPTVAPTRFSVVPVPSVMLPVPAVPVAPRRSVPPLTVVPPV